MDTRTIVTKLMPVFVVFLLAAPQPSYAQSAMQSHAKSGAHNLDTSDADLYNSTYDMCLAKAAEEGDEFMGFLQSEEDVEDFCGCTAQTALDVHRQNLDESALDAVIEEKTLQCLQPHIKPFVSNLCLSAAADNGITDVDQNCACLGEQVEAHSSNDMRDFLADSDKYLDASAKFCGLVD